ncbi:MAG: hypothetical protein K0S32_2712 [Bacteroidetes bacterium]|jgi:uncharacterized protein YijF (DUF1287 family)|nr:hypothetical protein [Bacteroidota bacterium]
MRILIIITAVFLLSFSLKQDQDFFKKFIAKAIDQTKQSVRYDPAYVQIKYPGGDVATNTGVCTDLVIRAYRGVGIDLQKEVHEDMVKRFSDYPKLWKLKKPDTNIDHRRVPNLMTYFGHMGAKLKVSDKPEDYKPGDLVTWNLQNKNVVSGITHIGVIIDQKSADGKRCMVAHNIGGGNVIEDILFSYTIIGHYRYKK